MRAEPDPLEPEVVAALEAIDATLAGEPAGREHAELAELSLILRDERPRVDPGFAARMDARVRERFAGPAPLGRPQRRERRCRWLVPGSAVAVLAAGIAAIVIALGGSGGPRVSSAPGGGTSAGSTTASGSAASAGSAGSAAGSGSATTPGSHAGSAAPKIAPLAPRAAPVPSPRSGAHRDVAQTARLSLRAAPGSIDAAAQRVFDVAGAERGIVASSHVRDSGGGGGSADFALRVPVGRLRDTLTRLSRLRGVRVRSREDSSADITDQVGGAGDRLGDDRALRRSLLADLASAPTATEVARLKARLRANAAAIGRDAAALARLRDRAAYSSIAVSLSAGAAHRAVAHHRRRTAGLTIGSAWHTAGRVLVVAAGVALIGLAVLIPLALLAAIAAAAWRRIARRRRESALGP